MQVKFAEDGLQDAGAARKPLNGPRPLLGPRHLRSACAWCLLLLRRHPPVRIVFLGSVAVGEVDLVRAVRVHRVSFSALLQVRNKLSTAFDEILKTPL